MLRGCARSPGVSRRDGKALSGGCATSRHCASAAPGRIDGMEGFGFFNDPDLQRRLQEMAEQMQSSQSLAWADNAIKLAVDMTVAAINRINVQGTAEQQAQQIRAVMGVVFPEAVTLVREARQGLA
jgi:predicted transcriptional regulator